MAGFRAVLKALRLAAKRDLGTVRAVKVNNLFLIAILLAYGEAESGLMPSASAPVLALVCFLLLFPLSSDPMARIPPTRSVLWPSSRHQWLALRVSSLALSPVFWIVALIVLKMRKPWFALTFLALGIGMGAIRGAGRSGVRFVPRFTRAMGSLPAGSLGQLIGNNLRQMFCVLDTYAAVLICAGSVWYLHFSALPDPAAPRVCAILIAIALATYAQCLFGLDFPSGAMTRYKLLPLKGWRILAAKDAAFLLLLFFLAAPVALIPGMTFGFAALAIGHHPSVLVRTAQHPWRLTGTSLLAAAVQMFCSLVLAFENSLLLSATLLCLSTWWYGRLFDRLSARKSALYHQFS